MRKLLIVLCALGVLLGGATPALADGPQVGADIQVAQTLGARELTVVIRRVDAVPGPVRVDVVTHAGSPAGQLDLRLGSSTERVSLGSTPGFSSATLQVDRPGPWELAVDDGTQVARIPFVVPVRASAPWENAAYGGFVAAGLLLVAALLLAMFGRIVLAMVPAGGMVAALAVAITAAVLSVSIPAPAPPGTQLDPTVDNVTDPYQKTSIVDFSRPPVNLVAGFDAGDVTLRLTDGATGRPVDDLLIHDNALIHLIDVSPQGRLQHLHPIRVAPGDYRAHLAAIEPGTHAVAAELARRGGGVQLLRASIQVSGAQTPIQEGKADVVTSVNPAGTPSTITARFGAKNLQPWLGMLGHMIVVGPVTDSATTAPIWAHVHAMIPTTPGLPDKPDESVAAFGPNVTYTYTFPLPGRYMTWIQVERDYSVITVPTMIDVPAMGGS
ncbi:hypothetical protein [Actinocrispum wychmicini]|uniref:Secreted protein n=1 Tax=Actinocrispum wychmicini TaxID=1213861 RepID=A0A4R2ISU9_9PSEU|nr:hypothetical protein [Actinocrispum wychmicini]TCO48147.1 hypothetical protein EV192_116200 [Actinocrispum wychmicini]